MSSRAKLVESDDVRSYDWHQVPALPALAIVEPIAEPIAEPVEAPEENFSLAVVAPPVFEPPPAERIAEIERAAHEAGYQAGYQSGHEEGQRAGAEAAGAQARGFLRRLGQTIEDLSATRQGIIRRTERQVVELALAIAKQMLQREINADRGLLLAMARVALDGLGGGGESATVRLNPDDYAIVSASPDPDPVHPQLTIVADASVRRSGCLVQCEAGQMDAGLESQFNELARTLLGDQSSEPADRLEDRRGANVPA